MKIAVMQGQAVIDDVEANLQAIEDAAHQTRSSGADVLVTPELFVTGYAPAAQREADADVQIRVLQRVAQVARTCQMAIVVSYPEVEFFDASDARRQYIAATLFDAEGRKALHYRKVHLFGVDEPQAFTASDDAPDVVDLGGMAVSLAICYDVEFPETVRAAALAGADVVLAPTALVEGFEDVPQVLLRARALENGVVVAYANHAGSEAGETFGGGSVIIGPNGLLLAEDGDEPGLIEADVSREQIEAACSRVPYLENRRPEVYAAWREASAREAAETAE